MPRHTDERVKNGVLKEKGRKGDIYYFFKFKTYVAQSLLEWRQDRQIHWEISFLSFFFWLLLLFSSSSGGQSQSRESWLWHLLIYCKWNDKAK